MAVGNGNGDFARAGCLFVVIVVIAAIVGGASGLLSGFAINPEYQKVNITVEKK